MEQLHKERNETIRATETQVLVALHGEKKLPQAAELVSELWSSKVKAEFMCHKNMQKLINRARDSRIPWMILVGEDEMKTGDVKLKNMETTKGELIRRNIFVEELKRQSNPVNGDGLKLEVRPE